MHDTVNLTDKERAALLRILEYERNTNPARDWPLGWSWSAVHTHPSVLNGLLLKGLLEERSHSNTYRGLAFTHSAARSYFQKNSSIRPPGLCR